MELARKRRLLLPSSLAFKDSPDTEPDVTYGYDLLGRMTSASQPGHSLSFSYDALGRQLMEAGPLGTVTSSWDAAGRRAGLTYPGSFGNSGDTIPSNSGDTIPK